MNKILIKRNAKKEWYAVIKAKNGKIIWQTPSAGVKRKRSVLRAIVLLAKEYKIVEEK